MQSKRTFSPDWPCHATAMRSCLRHRHRCSRSPRCLLAPGHGHVTLPRCAVAFAIATDAVGHRDAPKRTKDPKRFARPCLHPSPARSRPCLTSIACSLPAMAMSRYRDAQLPSPSPPMQSVTAMASPQLGLALEPGAPTASSGGHSRRPLGVSISRHGRDCDSPGSGLACDGHHEMSDLGVAGEPLHSGVKSVEPVCPHTSDDAG